MNWMRWLGFSLVLIAWSLLPSAAWHQRALALFLATLAGALIQEAKNEDRDRETMDYLSTVARAMRGECPMPPSPKKDPGRKVRP